MLPYYLKKIRRNMDMFLKLRILFSILSAIFVTAVLPMGIFLGFIWAIASAAVAGIFFFLMLICKQEQEKREALENTQTDTPSPTSSKNEEK